MRSTVTKLKQSHCRWCDFRAWGKNYAEVDQRMGAHILNNHEAEFRRWYDLPESEGGPKEKPHYKKVKSKVPVEGCPYCGSMPAVREDPISGELTVICNECEQLNVVLMARLPCDPSVIVEEWNHIAAIMNSQLFDGMVKKIMEVRYDE